MAFSPRPYQAAAVEAVLSRYNTGQRQMMVALPTGAGKTVVAALLIDALLQKIRGKRILFLSHRKEIIEQTAEKIALQIGPDRVTIEQADLRPSPHAAVVVASIQTIIGRLEEYDAETFAAVIIDECHHAFAPTWIRTISYFGRQEASLLLGLTATSRRSDGRCVSALFQDVAYEITQGELQEAGYLVPLSYYTVEASLGLSTIGRDNEGDFPVSFLGRIMNTPELISLTLRAWREQCSQLKTIAFCAGVDHAEGLAKAFRDMGITAASVSAQTPDRDRVIRDFRRGAIKVLTNYAVLTEGFDEPSIECVLLCRPTSSPLVYTQCLGRGLRTFPGKTQCKVIDIIDRQSHGLQYNAFESAGLKRLWKSTGIDPNREAAAIAKIRVTCPEAFLKIKNALSMDETQSILMGLKPESILAGIDGMPVLSYDTSEQRLNADAALSEAKRLVMESGLRARHMKLVIEADHFEILFDETERKRVSPYLAWHIQRATGWKMITRFSPLDLIEDFVPSEFDEQEFVLLRETLESMGRKQSRSRRQGAEAVDSVKRQGAQGARRSRPNLGTRPNESLSLSLLEFDEVL